MPFTEFHFLMFAQIGIDIVIIIVFLMVARRFRHSSRRELSEKTIKTFESLLTDADKTAEQFKKQLEEKHRLIRTVNEQLDKRISSLNTLLQRADALLSSQAHREAEAQENPLSLNSQEKLIIALAEGGYNLEEIAKRLSIPEGEVKLVLDLRKKLSEIGRKEGTP